MKHQDNKEKVNQEEKIQDKSATTASETNDSLTPSASGNEETPPESVQQKKHLLPRWLRVTLRVFGCIILFILLVPVLLYLEPVQKWVKNIACSEIYKATGMKVDIDRFRLKFPVDIDLEGVSVLYAGGDTMVRARKVEADVKLLPLLKLDVRLNKLLLEDGYYKMVSPDSSMIMKIRARLLTVDDKSSANIAASEINLHKAYLRDGDVSLYMDVWKQKPTPKDTTTTPFLINADELDIDNIRFSMSMLPTIDTLDFRSYKIQLRKGVINLRTNKINADYLGATGGDVTYLAPTPEYIAAHPAPVDTVSPPSPPMTIIGDTVSISGFKVLYATKGAVPLPGFDPSYIQLSGVNVGLSKFFNEASSIRLPITRLEGEERSGLRILEGTGTVSVDSVGLGLQTVQLRTVYSNLMADADIPFALMELNPHASMDIKANGTVGIPDIEAFMPSVKSYLKSLPGRVPLRFNIDSHGSLSRLIINDLDLSMQDLLSLQASGFADNPLDLKKMNASVKFDGSLERPKLIESLLGKLDYNIPSFRITGEATADHENYSAGFKLLTSAGNVVADGKIGMNSERYSADLSVEKLNVAAIMPSLGIGHVTASVKAAGVGFNPEKRSARTDIMLDVSSIVYNKCFLKNIKAQVGLEDGLFDIEASSANNALDFYLQGSGSIAPDNYAFDVDANLRMVDLQALGMSETMNSGSGVISLSGTASPARWLYNADLKVTSFDWNMPDQYIHLPEGLSASILATADNTAINITSKQTDLDFTSGVGLKKVIDGFMAVATTAQKQIGAKDLDIEALQPQLPPFVLRFNSGSQSVINDFLNPSGMSLDTIYADISNDSIFHGIAGVDGFSTGTMQLDTITLNLKQRGKLLDYDAHLGNRPGNLDEFAKVDLRGYVGSNRLGAYLVQHNASGENGYKLGLTAAMMDSTVSVHFTPLKATIAYLPWTLNRDNYIDYHLQNGRIQANLQGNSNESSILVKTNPLATGGDELQLKLDNIHVQDFLSMFITAPPVMASVNADVKVRYDGSSLTGDGTLGIRDFSYDKKKVGDFDFRLNAGMNSDGSSNAELALEIDGQPAMAAYARLISDKDGLKPDGVGLRLMDFPLKVANPMLGADIASLSGKLNGNMAMSGSFTKPILNGAIYCDSVGVYLPMMNTTLNLGNDSLNVADNIITLKDFGVLAANNNPLLLNGTVNAMDFSNISLNLAMNAKNFQLVNNKNKNSEIYGKLFLDLDATANGSMDRLNIKANASILSATDIYYTLQTAASDLTATNREDVVKFVNFNDTTQVDKSDSIVSPLNMRIVAGLTIQPGVKATVNLDGPYNPDKKVTLSPSGTLNYFQNYMGDMRLNGQLNLGEGSTRYSLPVMGEKNFELSPGSYVLFTGDVLNPTLNIKAFDKMKTNVSQSGNSRLVTFLVWLYVTNNLAAPNIVFNLTAEGDMSVQNELESMTPDQRATQAMNMLLYGQYAGPGIKTNSNLTGNLLYGMLENQLNNLAAQYVKGVDLSFGIDQYENTRNGNTQMTESYSYQLSKSLFDNRFKIMVGGKYSTDANADENFSQNLISDISFEYIIKQTNSLNMSVRLFRHTGFESILEGEITEMGVGFVMKRKLGNLRSLFRFGNRKRSGAVADTARNVGRRESDMNETISADSVGADGKEVLK